MIKDVMLFVLFGVAILIVFLCTKTKGFMTRQIPEKVLLAMRIIGSCILMLSVWGSWYGSFSAITFVLIAVIGIAAGYAFHTWAEHVKEKYKDEPLTEKEKQKFLKWISMGKWKFAFTNGVSLGFICTIIWSSVFVIWQSGDDLSFRDQFLSFATVILITFIMFSILGIASGLSMWDGIQDTAQKYSLLENSSDGKK